MTRLAMRPAKSFWKNVQLCRTTCQWFCQRIMLDRPGFTIWLIMTTWQSNASGRTSSSTPAMTSELRPGVAQEVRGRVGGDQADDAADEGRDGHVQHRDQAAEQEQRHDQPALLADECQ